MGILNRRLIRSLFAATAAAGLICANLSVSVADEPRDPPVEKSRIAEKLHEIREAEERERAALRKAMDAKAKEKDADAAARKAKELASFKKRDVPTEQEFHRHVEVTMQRLKHLEVAIDNLNAAGMPDLAKAAAQRAEALQRELREMREMQESRMRPQREGKDDEIHDLRQEIRELREELNQLRQKLPDLKKPLAPESKKPAPQFKKPAIDPVEEEIFEKARGETREPLRGE